MELNDKVTQLEDEIKILKNEVQAVLLDLRESFLSNINPFNPNPILTQIVSSGPVETSNDKMEVKTIEKTIPEPEVINPETLILEDKQDDLKINEVEEEFSGVETESELTVENPDDDVEDDSQMPGFFTESDLNNGNKELSKEVEKMVWHPALDTKDKFVQKDAIAVDENKLDLEKIEKLSRWVEDSVKRLGPERTRTILDITETMGYVNSDLKNILVKFIHPLTTAEKVSATTREYLSVLIDLSSLLKTDSRMEIALLFILITYQEYDNR